MGGHSLNGTTQKTNPAKKMAGGIVRLGLQCG